MYIVQGLLNGKSCLCKKFIRSNEKVQSQIEKKGPGLPGTFKKVLGLLDFFSPGTTGPRDLQGLQVLSCPVPSQDLAGTSRDFPGLYLNNNKNYTGTIMHFCPSTTLMVQTVFTTCKPKVIFFSDTCDDKLCSLFEEASGLKLCFDEYFVMLQPAR